MEVKNNYNECLTNLACSIRKYFGLDYKHNTLEYIDSLLTENKPENVVLMLFDGMGANIIDRILDKNSFFIKNKYKNITTVFPATTTAATISVRTGLNPCEHGWIGWNVYLKPIDKIITLFKNKEKGKEEISQEFLNIADKMKNNTIVSDINQKTNYRAVEFFPFGENAYENIDDMLTKIQLEINKPGKKFIYAYDDEPDHSMHKYGCDSLICQELIKERNGKVEEFCNNLSNTLVIIVADHGHLNVENIYLNDFEELKNMLISPTSIEQRAISFRVKKEYLNEFSTLFNKLFGKYFKLYSKKEVLENNLFGIGDKHEYFDSALGDYLAIAISNKCLVSDGDDAKVSHHAGYTDDEIYIPLIVINKG